MSGITIAPALLPTIRATYQAEIKSQTQDDKVGKLDKLRTKLTSLEKEETRLAGLFMTGKINKESYEQLRREWHLS